MFEQSFSDEEYVNYYALKRMSLEAVLGEKNELTITSLFGFPVGGPIDLNLFSNVVDGTAFVTMELIQPNGLEPLPNICGTYELISFTRLEVDTNDNNDTAFDKIALHMRGIMSDVGRYSFEHILSPLETFEIDNDEGENTYLFFVKYRDFKIGEKNHHLLACIEIFKSELDYARKETIIDLLEKLKAAGHYPYSDLDREPVA